MLLVQTFASFYQRWYRYNVQVDVDDGVLIQCQYCGSTTAPNVMNCPNWCKLHRSKAQRRHAVARLLRVRSQVKPLVERDAMMALALGRTASTPASAASAAGMDGEGMGLEGKAERVPFGMP